MHIVYDEVVCSIRFLCLHIVYDEVVCSIRFLCLHIVYDEAVIFNSKSALFSPKALFDTIDRVI